MENKINKVLTVFQFGLDSQAREEGFQKIDWPPKPYIHFKLKLSCTNINFELNTYIVTYINGKNFFSIKVAKVDNERYSQTLESGYVCYLYRY